jgi:ADP-ribose pyrophosphatase
MRNLAWKTLSSEILFSDKWFSIRKDKCETPGGKIVDPYYVYEFPTWVGAVPVTDDGKVLMVRQYRHALGETCIEIPGGCVDETDRSLEAAISRELLEETGYEFSSYTYLGKISPNPSTNTNLLHMFLAKGGRKVGEQQLDPNEEIEVMTFTTEELKALIKENKIIQSMHLSCIFYALSHLGDIKY